MFRKGVVVQACHTYYVILLAGKVCLDTAVLRLAGLGLVAGDRLGLAIPFGSYASGIDPEGCANVAPDAFGTAVGKFLVICVGADTVGVAGNFTLGVGEIHEEVANGLQFVMVLGFDVGLVGVEIDRQHGRLAAESLGSRCLHMDRHYRAAIHVNLFPGGGAWAFVEIIGYAVLVSIKRAAIHVNLYAGGCTGAFVEIIGYAVSIAIKRAAIRANLYTSGCTGAFVEIIGYAGAIGIKRAAIRVNLYTCRGAGAFVVMIEYAVLVGIKRAAILVNSNTGGGARTFIEIIKYAVLVGIKRAAILVNGNAGRCAGALVKGVEHAVVVTVHRSWCVFF